MQQICPKCLYKGKAKNNHFLGGTHIPLVGLMLGVGFVWFPTKLFSEPGTFLEYIILPLFPLVSLALAIYLIIDYYKNNNNLCPKCNNEKMIDLDTQEAENLINQYDLKV